MQENHYDPWGLNLADIETTPGSGADWWQFTGQEQDYQAYTEFDYRQYDRTLGRFTSVDPMADAFASISPFNYADNSPIANIDLYGLQGVRITSSIADGIRQAEGISLSGYLIDEVAVKAISPRTLAAAIPGLAPQLAITAFGSRFIGGLSHVAQQLSSWQGAGGLLRRSIEAPIQAVFTGYNGGLDRGIRDGFTYLGETPNRPVGQTLYDGTYAATDIAVTYAIAKGVSGAAVRVAGLRTGGYTTFYHGTSAERAAVLRSNGVSMGEGYQKHDFGQGFYLAPTRAEAIKSAAKHLDAGFDIDVVEFKIPNSGLNSLSSFSFTSTDGLWQDFGRFNKRGIGTNPLESTYDMMYGPMFGRFNERTGLFPHYQSRWQYSIHTEKAMRLFNKHIVK